VEDVSTLLFYEVVPDYVERRAPLREEHLRLAREARERGELLLAGAHTDEQGAFDGALFVFSSDDFAFAERFAQGDPYVKNGLVTRHRIRKWNVVVGELPSL
jgi:hypothetical protein